MSMGNCGKKWSDQFMGCLVACDAHNTYIHSTLWDPTTSFVPVGNRVLRTLNVWGDKKFYVLIVGVVGTNMISLNSAKDALLV